MTPDERAMLVRVDERVNVIHEELTTRLPAIENRVDALESHRDRAAGWIAGAGAILTAVWGALEWFFHMGKHR